MSSDETGSCELSWPFWSCIVVIVLVLLLLSVVLLLRHRALRALSVALDANKEKQIEVALKQASRLLVSESDTPFYVAKRQLKALRGKYTDYEALLQLLDQGVVSGGMKLLRGSWLCDSQNIRRLRRQQDLPNEAFWNTDELRSQLTVVGIVAISYCWLHPVNPDPHSKHLRVLQRAIEMRLGLEGPGQIRDLAIFLDFASLPQHGEQGDEANPVRGDCRTESEEVAFKRGLKDMNILYASQLVETWMIKWTPEDEPRTYMRRGWQFFQQAVSSLIKPATMLIDLDACIVLFAYDWIDVHRKARIGRYPPLIPSIFRIELSKSYDKAENELIEDTYEETFRMVVGTAKALWFTGLGWCDQEAICLVDIFPFAVHLERVVLSNNFFSRVGAKALVQASGQCPSLEYLDLSGNLISEADFDGLLQIWQSIGKPSNGLLLAPGRSSSRRDLAKPIGHADVEVASDYNAAVDDAKVQL